jgi:hypothetical protein
MNLLNFSTSHTRLRTLLSIYVEHIPHSSGSSSDMDYIVLGFSSSDMDYIVLGFKRMKILKPSNHHRHCLRMACLKEPVAYGRWPSI